MAATMAGPRANATLDQLMHTYAHIPPELSGRGRAQRRGPDAWHPAHASHVPPKLYSTMSLPTIPSPVVLSECGLQ